MLPSRHWKHTASGDPSSNCAERALHPSYFWHAADIGCCDTALSSVNYNHVSVVVVVFERISRSCPTVSAMIRYRCVCTHYRCARHTRRRICFSRQNRSFPSSCCIPLKPSPLWMFPQRLRYRAGWNGDRPEPSCFHPPPQSVPMIRKVSLRRPGHRTGHPFANSYR